MIDASRYTVVDADTLALMGKSQQEHFIALTIADALSQVVHGEQGGLLVSCRLANYLPERDAKMFAASQAMDEARHMEVFSRYVERLHDIAPPSPTLCRVLDTILTAKHWQAQLIGMQIMIEGLALANFSAIRNATNCDLLRELLRLVMRDEARHVAFGHQYLKRILGEMHADDLAEVEDFALGMVVQFRQWGNQPDDLQNVMQMLIQVGIDPMDFIQRLRKKLTSQGAVDLTPKMMRGVEQIIMPSLERIGLISDRVRPFYCARELETAMDLRTLDELERSLVG
ncbi:MAG: ferritin-like domain-containing protein [Burkholderiaceae bacterium]